MHISKVIAASLGSTAHTLDRPTARGPRPSNPAKPQRPKASFAPKRTPKPARSTYPWSPPKAEAPKPQAKTGAVQIIINLMHPQ